MSAPTLEEASDTFHEALTHALIEARRTGQNREARLKSIEKLRKGLCDQMAVDYVSREDYDALKRQLASHEALREDMETLARFSVGATAEEPEWLLHCVLEIKNEMAAAIQRATAAETQLEEWQQRSIINRGVLLELALAANHVMQPWDETPVPQLVEACKQRMAASETRATAAEAACAEMRDWIDRLHWDHHDCCEVRCGGDECDCGGKEIYKSKKEILSQPNLGTGWLSPDEAAKLRNQLNARDQACSEMKAAILKRAPRIGAWESRCNFCSAFTPVGEIEHEDGCILTSKALEAKGAE